MYIYVYIYVHTHTFTCCYSKKKTLMKISKSSKNNPFSQVCFRLTCIALKVLGIVK